MKKVEAFILQKIPQSEANETLVCYTKEQGKISFMARGVKKPGAKLAGSLQQFNLADIYFVEGRHFPITTDVVVKENFSVAKTNPETIDALGAVCNFVARTMPRGAEDFILWGQMMDYFKTLNKKNDKEFFFRISPSIFIYKILCLHGFSPELDNCTECRKIFSQSDRMFFSFPAGGLLCSQCVEKDPASLNVSGELIEILKTWAMESYDNLLEKELPANKEKNLVNLVEKFCQWHLGFRPNFTLS